MQTALDHHLKEKDYSLLIVKGREKLVEGKVGKLRNEGKGKLPNKSQSRTREEEEVLWECGQLGNSCPKSLLTKCVGSCHSTLVCVAAENTMQRMWRISRLIKTTTATSFYPFQKARKKHGKEVYDLNQGLYFPKCSQLATHDALSPFLGQEA